VGLALAKNARPSRFLISFWCGGFTFSVEQLRVKKRKFSAGRAKSKSGKGWLFLAWNVACRREGDSAWQQPSFAKEPFLGSNHFKTRLACLIVNPAAPDAAKGYSSGNIAAPSKSVSLIRFNLPLAILSQAQANEMHQYTGNCSILEGNW